MLVKPPEKPRSSHYWLYLVIFLELVTIAVLVYDLFYATTRH